MGQMHFDVPDMALGFFESSRWREAYLCGIEGVPWQTQNVFEAGRLTLSRSVDSSAKLLITCPVPTIGYRLLTTCSLRCLPTSHRLLVELARGSCFRVRIQADTWQRGGLALSDRFEELLDQGTRHFIDAVQGDGDDEPSVTAAIQAITLLEQAATELGELFTAQSIAFRRTRETRLSTMMGVTYLPPPSPEPGELDVGIDWEQVGHTFNAVAVRMSWGDIETASGHCHFEPVARALEACTQSGLRVIGGPLVDYRDGLLPEWLSLLNGQFDKLIGSMTDFVDAAVMQFRGRVNLWNAASCLNVAGPLPLDDEQIMRLAIGAVQSVRRCDPNTPVIISLDQPCGEYLAKDQDGISPLHFADALLRSGLGLAGIGLNFRFGFTDGESNPRSAIEFAQLIDRWATLNAPLLVQISVAGSTGDDPEARLSSSTRPLSPNLNGDPAAWARSQYAFTKPLIDTLLAKQIVHAVVWEGWSDQHRHLTPHSGLIDPAGQPRPILDYLTQVRSEMLL